MHMQVADIDSSRMVVHVRQGKGQKDRQVPLSRRLLEALRAYWRYHRPTTWLFPNRTGDGPWHGASFQRRFRKVVARAGVKKPATMHTLRHNADSRIMPTPSAVSPQLRRISRFCCCLRRHN
jgi:integrase